MATIAAGAVSCTIGEIDDAGLASAGLCQVTLDFNTRTKSMFDSALESEINNVCVFMYDSNHQLAYEHYWDVAFSDDDPLSNRVVFNIRKGNYTAYAVANMGDKTGASRDESEFQHALSYAPRIGNLVEGGIPMAGRRDVSITQDCLFSLPVERLMAKYNLSVDLSGMSHGGSLTVQSAELRQCQAYMYPFYEDYFDDNYGDMEVIDGVNDHSSSIDVAKLNSGRTVVLYVPENLQGDDGSIELTTDKVPGNMIYPDQCTYLELHCRYENGGMSCDDLVYRMYLGENSTSSFNIRRNTSYDLTFCPQEENIYDCYWKCTGAFNDGRSMSFSSSSRIMYLMDDIRIPLVRSGDFEYETDVDDVYYDYLMSWQPPIMDDFILEMDGDVLHTSAGMSLGRNQQTVENFTVSAWSWDERKEASTKVTVVPMYGYFNKHDIYLNYGETGSAIFHTGGNVWYSHGLTYNSNGNDGTGISYTIGSLSTILNPYVTTARTKKVTVTNTNTTANEYVYRFVGVSVSEQARYMKRDTLYVHIRPYSMAYSLPRMHFSNGDVDNTTIYKNQDVIAYFRDSNTGRPVNMADFEVTSEQAKYFEVTPVDYEVDGEVVDAYRIKCIKVMGQEIRFEACDDNDYFVWTDITGRYMPVTITLQNSEESPWHLEYVVDNPSDMAFDIVTYAIATGMCSTVTTSENVPTVSGARKKTLTSTVQGTTQVTTYFYKDYNKISEIDAYDKDTDYRTDLPDGTTVYDVFTDEWRPFTDRFGGFESFSYKRWVTYSQRAVQSTATIKEMALRFRIYIDTERAAYESTDYRNITFINNLGSTQTWSAVYYGWYDDPGYGLKEPWVYVNGEEINNGSAWNANYPL